MQKHFSEEFKRAAIARVQNGETQVEVAQSLHISPKTLNRWCVKAKEVLPPENVSLIEENARLRKALKQREAEVEFLKKSRGVLRQDAVKKYAFLQDGLKNTIIGRHNSLPITRACELLEVSTSGFYAWCHADQQHRYGVIETDDYVLTTLKAEILKTCKGHVPGVLVCHHLLREKGLRVDLKRLRRLMRNNGLLHRFHRKYVQTTDSNHDLKKSPNLIERRFDQFGINQAWCGDITYTPTSEGWLYLASVLDLGTRRLVGYSFGAQMTKQLVIDALLKAYKNETPSAGCIFHSDQGSQYCSVAFQDTLTEHHMISSMSRRGQCWDNAPAESFWATLKRESLPVTGSFESRAQAQKTVQDWIYYHNGRRPHSKLSMKSPNAYYAELLKAI